MLENNKFGFENLTIEKFKQIDYYKCQPFTYKPCNTQNMILIGTRELNVARKYMCTSPLTILHKRYD